MPGKAYGISLKPSSSTSILIWVSLVARAGKKKKKKKKKTCLQCRPGFDPWVEMVPWRREQLPTPGFCPGEFHGLYSPWGHKESHMTE